MATNIVKEKGTRFDTRLSKEQKYIFEKVLQDIDNWKKLKGKNITKRETAILKNLYKQSI